MPKQNYEIKRFTYGIVSNPEDTRDIPDDAASYSKNIDPLIDGALSGIPDDMYLKGSGFISDIGQISYVQGGASSGSYGNPKGAIN